MIAYSFIRKNLFEYYFILIGRGANGKSVFIGKLSKLHGLKNISNVSLKSLVNERFTLVDLVNKDIILVQPYLSSYYETTKLIMQQQQPSSTTTIYPNKENIEFKRQINKNSSKRCNNNDNQSCSNAKF